MKWKLARLSAALAFLTLSSTEDYRRVIVTKEHVKYVVDFVESEYKRAGLHILAQVSRYETLDEEEAQQLIDEISVKVGLAPETIVDIIRFIVMQGRVTREQVKTKFCLSENKELRPLLAELANEKLIKSGKGIYPTSRMIDLYRILDHQGYQGYQRYQPQKKTPTPYLPTTEPPDSMGKH